VTTDIEVPVGSDWTLLLQYLRGRILHQEVVTTGTTELPISGISQGLYVVQLQNSSTVLQPRVVIQ